LLGGTLVVAGCSGGDDQAPATPAEGQDDAATPDDGTPAPPAPPMGSGTGKAAPAEPEATDTWQPTSPDQTTSAIDEQPATGFGSGEGESTDAFGAPDAQPAEGETRFGNQVAPSDDGNGAFGQPGGDRFGGGDQFGGSDQFGASSAPADESAPAKTVTGALGKALFKGFTSD